MSVLQAGLLNQSSAQVIDGSLKFNDSANQHLERTISAGNRRTFTLSVWAKHSTTDSNDRFLGNYTDANNYSSFYIRDTPDFQISFVERVSSTYNINAHSRRMARDTGWYHIVWAVDTTQATDTDRVKLYVNGVQETLNASYSSGTLNTNAPTLPSQNYESRILAAYDLRVGARSGTDCWDGLMSQFYVIDGQALGPENFGFTDPLTGTWRPKKYTGSFTTTSSLDGTVWTSKHSGTVYGGSVANVFDNDLTNRAEINSSDSNNNHFTISSISLSSASSVGVYVSNSGSDVEVSVNDTVVGTIASGSITSSSQLFSFSFTETTVTSIKVRRVGSTSGWYLYGILVNSTQLIDGENVIAGVNSFYLPMDGNSPIGQDKSGNGNDFTPVNFGGSVALDNPIASGALPILNTTPGGVFASVGVRTDAYAQGDPNNQLSRNYSINTTATGGFSGSYPKTNLFDGAAPADGNRAEAASNDDPINITFDPPITVSSTISLWSGKSSTKYQINNSGSYTTYSDAVGSYKDISHSGSLSNIKILHGSAGQAAGISAIKIDGTQLIDSGLVLALPLVGNKEDVVASINSAQTNVTVTNNGSVPFQTTQSNFYGGSAFFEDSSSDNLTFTNFGSRFEFTGDYTIEAWIYPTDSGAADGSIFVENSGSNYFAFNFDPGTQFNIYNNESTPSWSPSTNLPPANKWSHIALVRSGSTQTIYVNGNSIATNTASGTHGYASPSFARIGGGASSGLDSYIQDLRVYNGVAKYTSNFIPASTSPDILPDTPSGVSGGSKLTKITDGAVAFDGSGDDLELADSADWDYGTDPFTIEFYVYPNVLSGVRPFISVRQSGNGGWGAYWYNNLVYFIAGSDANNPSISYTTSANALATKKWSHIAFVRNGNTFTTYIDGVSKGTTSNTGGVNNDGDDVLTIGRVWPSGMTAFDGFISNVRIIKGTALYTSNFTPPTAPLTNVTNTKLLCCQSNTSGNFAAVSPATFSNDGTVWSSGVTFSPSVLNADRGADKAFNGTISNNASTTSNNPALLTASFSTNLTSVTSLRIYSGSNSSNAYINGASGSTVSITANNWTDLTSLASGASGTISSISVVTAGDNAQLAAVEVNGCILVDGLVGEALLRAGDASATTFNPFNTDINTVRGQETGYATLNPLIKGSQVTLSDGNLSVSVAGGTGRIFYSTLGASSGKWYAEYTAISASATNMIGVSRPYNPGGNYLGVDSNYGYGYYGNGQKYNGSGVSYADSYTTGDTIGIALDLDERTLTFYKNGVSQGVAFSSLPVDDYFFAGGEGSMQGTMNFGQKPFKFPPPEGFQPLNAANVRPETVIARPDQYVGITTWSGDNADPRQIDLGMAPDLIWVKTRNQTNWHWLSDSLRGTADKRYKLYSNDQTAQDTAPIYGQADSFNDSGFIAGGGTHNTNPLSDSNQSGTNYVCWSWKAGGSKGTFNVDDVGYANASDVNMSVGALNNIAFNKTQNWSGNATGGQNVGRAFDGTGPRKDHYSHTSGSLTVNFSPALSGRIIVYGGAGGSGARTFTLSDGSSLSSGVVYDTEPYYSTLDFGVKSNITSLTCSNGYTLYGITVDGKLLVDSGVSIDAPTIANSKCSVGTKQGFSIINFTNTTSNSTHAHGLTQKPDFIVMKKTNGTSHWPVYHSSMGPKYGYLNLTNAFVIGSGEMWNYTEPNDHYVTLKGEPNTFGSAGDVIMYCWHDVPGLQKFGSYLSQGGNDANYVHLGFRPAILWIKSAVHVADTTSWCIFTDETYPNNPFQKPLYANKNINEGYRGNASNEGTFDIDLLSNGFKLRTNVGEVNEGGANDTYVYCAWAKAPAVNLYGGQSNAR